MNSQMFDKVTKQKKQKHNKKHTHYLHCFYVIFQSNFLETLLDKVFFHFQSL